MSKIYVLKNSTLFIHIPATHCQWLTRLSTDLSISVSNRPVTICCRQHCRYSVSTTCDRSVENSIAAAPSEQIVKRPVDKVMRLCPNRLSQDDGMHPDIGLLTTSCNRPVADLFQLARNWLCTILKITFLRYKARPNQ